jgi:hypothetical protein
MGHLEFNILSTFPLDAQLTIVIYRKLSKYQRPLHRFWVILFGEKIPICELLEAMVSRRLFQMCDFQSRCNLIKLFTARREIDIREKINQ